MTGMYLILFHDLMSPMLGDITIIFLMISNSMTSQYHDITICMVCAFIYLILIKKYAVYYLLSLCMNVMFQDFFV